MSAEKRTAADIDIGRAMIAAVVERSLEPMRLAARSAGYALAVHGSLARDIDLIAVPWTSHAEDAETLHCNLVGAAAASLGRAWPEGEWADRPHGRRARNINAFVAGSYVYFDVSVMPLAKNTDSPPPIGEMG